MTGNYEDPEASALAGALGEEFWGADGCAVLGSGLSGAAEVLGAGHQKDYFTPAGKTSSAPGHPGKVGVARVGDKKLLVFMGRPHYYEDGSMSSAALTVRVARALGARLCILFSAVGGIGKEVSVGDWVFVSDHLNLMGQNPLLGVGTTGGPPFLDLTNVYRNDLYKPICKALPEIPIKSGILAGFCGPTYETPAEVRMAAMLGASTVGMSGIPESVWARFLGMDVVAFGKVSNLAAGEGKGGLSHEEVLRETGAGGPEAARIVRAALSAWRDSDVKG